MPKQIIHTANAPKAIGCYSQAVKVGRTVYLSGQIPLDPNTMQMVEGIDKQIHQVFKNIQAVIMASGGSFIDIVKLTIYLTDMENFALVNQIMSEYFSEPCPARAVIGVKELPRGALVEIEGTLVLTN